MAKLKQEATFSGITGIIVILVTVVLFISNGVTLSSALPVAAFLTVLLGYFIYVLFRAPRILETKRQAEIEGQPQRQLMSATDEIELIKSEHQRKIGILERNHEEEIRRRERVFNDQKGQIEALKERLDDAERYNWIVGIAEKQAREIDRYVILQEIARGDVRLHPLEGVPFIYFDFHIVNKSIFDITVELETNDRNCYVTFGLRDGFLDLKGERYFGRPTDTLNISDQRTGIFTIEQRLSREEAHTIAGRGGQDDAIFYFDKLIFTIRGNNAPPQVAEKRLVIDKAVTLSSESLPMRR